MPSGCLSIVVVLCLLVYGSWSRKFVVHDRECWVKGRTFAKCCTVYAKEDCWDSKRDAMEGIGEFSFDRCCNARLHRSLSVPYSHLASGRLSANRTRMLFGPNGLGIMLVRDVPHLWAAMEELLTRRLLAIANLELEDNRTDINCDSNPGAITIHHKRSDALCAAGCFVAPGRVTHDENTSTVRKADTDVNPSCTVPPPAPIELDAVSYLDRDELVSLSTSELWNRAAALNVSGEDSNAAKDVEHVRTDLINLILAHLDASHSAKGSRQYIEELQGTKTSQLWRRAKAMNISEQDSDEIHDAQDTRGRLIKWIAARARMNSIPPVRLFEVGSSGDYWDCIWNGHPFIFYDDGTAISVGLRRVDITWRYLDARSVLVQMSSAGTHVLTFAGGGSVTVGTRAQGKTVASAYTFDVLFVKLVRAQRKAPLFGFPELDRKLYAASHRVSRLLHQVFSYVAKAVDSALVEDGQDAIVEKTLMANSHVHLNQVVYPNPTEGGRPWLKVFSSDVQRMPDDVIEAAARGNVTPQLGGTHNARIPYDPERWHLLQEFHRDAHFGTVQAPPVLLRGDEGYMKQVYPHEMWDGTFLMDPRGSMHRFQLGPSDVAVWFGTPFEKKTKGRMRAMPHTVLFPAWMRDGWLFDGWQRQSTQLHIYPVNARFAGEGALIPCIRYCPNRRVFPWKYGVRVDVDLQAPPWTPSVVRT